MKKFLSFIMLLPFFVGCNDNESITQDSIHEEFEMLKINILVNDYSLSASLEDNETGKAFYDMVQDGLTLELEEYGGFEKVGSLGKSLPRNDTRITTKAGDLILYQGSEFSLMYGSNTWSYTKIGSTDNVESINLKNILGTGDVAITITK